MGFFDDWFGGSGAEAADKANRAYQDWMNKSIGTYNQFWQQGRGDVLGMYNQGLGFLNPYMKAGQEALGDYQATLGEGGGMAGQNMVNKFKQSPGYQFQMQQGLNAINRSAAARGLAGGGGTSKALQEYGQGLANQEYGQYQNRLGQLAGMGQQSAGQAFQGALGTGQYLGSLGAQYAGDIGSAYGGMGQSAANSIMAGQAADQATRSNWINQLGMLGGMALGGPFGGFLGSSLSNYLGNQQRPYWNNPDTGNRWYY